MREHSLPLTAAKAAIPAALCLFFVSVLLSSTSSRVMGCFLAAAGVIIVVRCYLMLTYPDQVLEPLAERERRGIGGRVGLFRETSFGAVLLLVIGVGWAVCGALLIAGTI